MSVNGTRTKAAAIKNRIAEHMVPEAAPRIVIPAPDLRLMRLKVTGLSPLMVHAWSDKAKKMMERAQSGAPKTRKRDPRDPQAEYEASMYRTPDGGHGFPAAAFKKAAVSACRLIDGITMTQARSLFIVLGDLVRLEGEPHFDARPVRLQGNTADMRYRAVYNEWSTELSIRYFAGATSAEQIVNLLVLAGECVGVGEARPEKGDSYGRFTVAG